jgi:hypothetical protein
MLLKALLNGSQLNVEKLRGSLNVTGNDDGSWPMSFHGPAVTFHTVGYLTYNRGRNWKDISLPSVYIYILYVDGYRRRTSTNCSSQVLLLLLKLLQVGLPQPFLKRFLTVGESGEVSPLSPKRNYSFLSAVNLSAPQIQVAFGLWKHRKCLAGGMWHGGLQNFGLRLWANYLKVAAFMCLAHVAKDTANSCEILFVELQESTLASYQ